MLDFYVKRRTRISLRDKRLFEIIEAEITRVDCILRAKIKGNKLMFQMEAGYIDLNKDTSSGKSIKQTDLRRLSDNRCKIN